MIYYVEIYTVGDIPQLIDKWAINECDISIKQAVNNVIARNLLNRGLEVQYNIKIAYLNLSCSLTARMSLHDLCKAFKISSLRMKEIKKEKVVNAREKIESLITLGQAMVTTFWFNRPPKKTTFTIDAMYLMHDLKSMFENIIDCIHDLWDVKNYIYVEVSNIAKNILTELENYSKEIQTEYSSIAVINDVSIAMADILKILRSETE